MRTSTATKHSLTRTLMFTTHIISTSTISRGTEGRPTRTNTATSSSRMSIRTIRTCTTGTVTPDASTSLCPIQFETDLCRSQIDNANKNDYHSHNVYDGVRHEVSTAGGGIHRTGLGRPRSGGRHAGVRPGDQG